MSIKIKEYVGEDYSEKPYYASKFYISIPNKYLSEPYELFTDDKIIAKIIKLDYGGDVIKELENLKITLYLAVTPVYDRLYISKKDWNENFRENGLVEPGYQITLELTDAIKNKKTIKLYTKRIIKIGLE